VSAQAAQVFGYDLRDIYGIGDCAVIFSHFIQVFEMALKNCPD